MEKRKKTPKVVDTGEVELSGAYVSALQKLSPERRKHWLKKLVEKPSAEMNPGSEETGVQ